MSTLMIRNVDPSLKERLRVRAAKAGRSMEAELRAIVGKALNTEKSEVNIAEAIRRRFAPFGGVELDIPPRTVGRDPPDFT